MWDWLSFDSFSGKLMGWYTQQSELDPVCFLIGSWEIHTWWFSCLQWHAFIGNIWHMVSARWNIQVTGSELNIQLCDYQNHQICLLWIFFYRASAYPSYGRKTEIFTSLLWSVHSHLCIMVLDSVQFATVRCVRAWFRGHHKHVNEKPPDKYAGSCFSKGTIMVWGWLTFTPMTGRTSLGRVWAVTDDGY